MSDQRFSYGGQAVLEGVMMRGRRQASVAVRKRTGEIVCKHFPLNIKRRDQWDTIPFLRGLVMLWDMLVLGTKALNFSADVVSDEEKQHSTSNTVVSLSLAITGTIGLFFVVPLFLANLTGYLGATLVVRELVEAGIRIGFILGYVVLIGRVPEIQRVFAYHGAEHKVVNAYEAGASLQVEHVRSFSLIHPRCGTSFLVIVMMISLVVFFFVGGLPLWIRIVSRVVFVPLIAALAYEVVRISSQQYYRPLVRMLMAPSLAFQQLTTREPDDSMIVTAIVALQSVLVADGIEPCDAATGDETVLRVPHVTW